MFSGTGVLVATATGQVYSGIFPPHVRSIRETVPMSMAAVL